MSDGLTACRTFYVLKTEENESQVNAKRRIKT